MAILSHYLSIITLNGNGLNSPIKRHRMAEWIKKQDPVIYCLQQTNLILKDKYRLRIEEWKKLIQANGNQNGRVSYTYIRQIDFQLKMVKRH